MPMAEAIKQFLKQSGLGSGHNTQCIFEAWDEVSGAAGYTLSKFFRDGVLYVTLKSSMARMQLEMQKQDIIAGINLLLSRNGLFIKDDPNVQYVKELKLK